MYYESGGKQYCGPWTVKWNFHMEAFVRDGESSGIGRFVGIVDGVVAVQLWVVGDSLKIEHAQGYAVQLDVDSKVITVLNKITLAD